MSIDKAFSLHVSKKKTDNQKYLAIREKVQAQPDREAGYPYVYKIGMIENKVTRRHSLGIIWIGFSGPKFFTNEQIPTDATANISATEFQFEDSKSLYLTGDEAFALVKYAGVTMHDPRSLVPMKLTLGITFALLIGVVTKFAMTTKDIMLAGPALILFVAFLYPLIYLLWHYSPGLRRVTRPAVDFDVRTLVNEGLSIAFLLIGALPFVPLAADTVAPTKEFSQSTYISNLLLAIYASGGFIATSYLSQAVSTRGYNTMDREAIESYLVTFFTPLFAFPSLLMTATGAAHGIAKLTGYTDEANSMQDLSTPPGITNALITIFALPGIFVGGHSFAKGLVSWLFSSKEIINTDAENELLLSNDSQA